MTVGPALHHEPVLCARPGCGLPWTAHLPPRPDAPTRRVAVGCPGFCWITPRPGDTPPVEDAP